MGQRLVIDLIQDDEVVASVYYHWSAYFGSTIAELANLSEAILEADKAGKDKLLAVIERLETVHAHIDYKGDEELRRGGVRGVEKEYEAAKKLFPNHEFATEHVDRNEGIISFTKEGIESYHNWGEGFASIDLGTLEISNSVEYEPDPFEFVDAEYEEENGYKYITVINSGRVGINGKISPVDAFDCNCVSVIELMNFLNTEYKKYMRK